MKGINVRCLFFDTPLRENISYVCFFSMVKISESSITAANSFSPGILQNIGLRRYILT